MNEIHSVGCGGNSHNHIHWFPVFEVFVLHEARVIESVKSAAPAPPHNQYTSMPLSLPLLHTSIDMLFRHERQGVGVVEHEVALGPDFS